MAETRAGRKTRRGLFSKRLYDQSPDIDEKQTSKDVQVSSEEQVAIIPVEAEPVPVPFFQLFKFVLFSQSSQQLSNCYLLPDSPAALRLL